jgi:hypothetical protein
MNHVLNIEVDKKLQIPHNKLNNKLYKKRHIITIEDLLSGVIIPE